MSTDDTINLLNRPVYELQEFTVEGQIVTLKEADKSQLGEMLSLVIDEQPFQFPRAIISRDVYGNPLVDREQNTVYRFTTVYDAVDKFYVRLKSNDKNPIPILCHQQHLEPVAMCRVCMVLVAGPEFDAKGKPKLGEKGEIIYGRESLAPACHRTLDDHMKIFTPRHPAEDKRKKMAKVSKIVLELLISDHGDPQAHNKLADLPREEREMRPEFYTLLREQGLPPIPRFPRASAAVSRPIDESSFFIAVDHSSCILCDRCIRSCTDIKKNKIIGRTGSGYRTRISFDLDQPMGQSDCVECGECAASCPTDALTFKHVIEPEWD